MFLSKQVIDSIGDERDEHFSKPAQIRPDLVEKQAKKKWTLSLIWVDIT